MENTGAICYYYPYIAEGKRVVKTDDVAHTFIHLRRNGGSRSVRCVQEAQY